MSGPCVQHIYNLFGQPGTPVTLTDDFTDNESNPAFFRYFRRLMLEGVYTPAENDSFLEILVEYSNDDPAIYPNGGPTNWRPLTTQVPATTEIDNYADDGTDMGSRAGIPIIIPGDKTSVASRAIPFTYNMTDVLAFWVRISLREHTSGAFGTTDIEASIQD